MPQPQRPGLLIEADEHSGLVLPGAEPDGYFLIQIHGLGLPVAEQGRTRRLHTVKTGGCRIPGFDQPADNRLLRSMITETAQAFSAIGRALELRRVSQINPHAQHQRGHALRRCCRLQQQAADLRTLNKDIVGPLQPDLGIVKAADPDQHPRQRKPGGVAERKPVGLRGGGKVHEADGKIAAVGAPAAGTPPPAAPGGLLARHDQRRGGDFSGTEQGQSLVTGRSKTVIKAPLPARWQVSLRQVEEAVDRGSVLGQAKTPAAVLAQPTTNDTTTMNSSTDSADSP